MFIVHCFYEKQNSSPVQEILFLYFFIHVNLIYIVTILTGIHLFFKGYSALSEKTIFFPSRLLYDTSPLNLHRFSLIGHPCRNFLTHTSLEFSVPSGLEIFFLTKSVR